MDLGRQMMGWGGRGRVGVKIKGMARRGMMGWGGRGDKGVAGP